MTQAFDTGSLRHARWALAVAAAVLAIALAPTPAQAHAPSNATLSLAAEADHGVQQRWDIALRDLDRVLPLDADDDGQITWAELRAAWPQVVALADDGLRLSTDRGACVAAPVQAPRVDGHADGTYAVLERRWQCPGDAGAAGLRVDYRLFADADASHRGLLQWRAAPQAAAATAVLAPSAGPVSMAGMGPTGIAAPGAAPGADAPPSTLLGFVGEGVHHILIGTDHVLFLLALLLPSVLLPAAGARWTQALVQVAKVVTAFTVAHSITLALAVLGIANPPSRIVESLIAASVVLAAVDNLKRFLPGVRWQLAFVFGLVHGFGFAGALAELGLDEAALARSLVGFNLGVELGQLGIVAVALPLAWWLRHTVFYRRAVLGGGSLAIAAVAALWFVERAFDVAV